MPPLPPIANVLRLRLTGTLATSPWANINYARYSGSTPTAADLNTVATSVATAWQNALGQLCFTDRIIQAVQVIDLSSDTAAEGLWSGSHPGTRTGTPLPNNCALVLSFLIQRRYRGGHPRMYVPAGVSADVVSGNLFSSTFLTLARSSAASYVTNINAILLGGTGLQHGTVSYYTRDPANPGHSMLRATPLFFPTQSTAVHGRVDSMRRRLGKEIG